MPDDLPGLPVERQHRGGIQVVAEAQVPVPVRRRVAAAPVDEVEFWVVDAGQPGRRAAGTPGIAGPGFVAGLARSRHRVGTPPALAGRGVIAVDEAADAELAARDARDHRVADDQRRRRLAVTLHVVGHLGVPEQGARAGVDRHQVGVVRAHVQGFAQDRHAAVVAAAAQSDAVRQRVLVTPVRPPRQGVDRGHVAGRLGDEHDAVDHQRRRLVAVELPDLVRPLQLQTLHVPAVDLIQPAEALPVQRAVVHEPVVRLVVRVHEPFPGHRREERHAVRRGLLGGRRLRGGQEQRRADPADRSQESLPRKEARYATRSSRPPSGSGSAGIVDFCSRSTERSDAFENDRSLSSSSMIRRLNVSSPIRRPSTTLPSARVTRTVHQRGATSAFGSVRSSASSSGPRRSPTRDRSGPSRPPRPAHHVAAPAVQPLERTPACLNRPGQGSHVHVPRQRPQIRHQLPDLLIPGAPQATHRRALDALANHVIEASVRRRMLEPSGRQIRPVRLLTSSGIHPVTTRALRLELPLPHPHVDPTRVRILRLLGSDTHRARHQKQHPSPHNPRHRPNDSE